MLWQVKNSSLVLRNAINEFTHNSPSAISVFQKQQTNNSNRDLDVEIGTTYVYVYGAYLALIEINLS